MGETLSSLSVLAVLVAVAAGVYHFRQPVNPAVLALGEVETLLAASKPSQGEAETIALPDGIRAVTPPETFDARTLSDKINGKAELYLAAGFVRLETRRLSLVGADTAWMELFIYEMGSPENAYAVFSSQRREAAEPLEGLRHAYLAGNAVFLAAGSRYMEIVGAKADALLMEKMTALAREMAGTSDASDAALPEADLFPPMYVKMETLAMIPADAFGFDRFNCVFTALCRVGDKEMTAFLSPRASREEAAELAKAYAAFLAEYGGRVLEDTGKSPPEARVMEILGTFEIVFEAGDVVAGVREAMDLEAARTLAEALYTRIREASDGS